MTLPGSAPRYAVVSLADEPAAIVAHGVTSTDVFRQQFLDRYGLRGERYRPAEPWTVHGTLVATDGATVVAVPIVTWRAPDGTARFLCQATDDGSPPAVSVIASSENDLLRDLAARLRPSGS